MSDLILDHPWLEFDLAAEMQVLSWSINRPVGVSVSYYNSSVVVHSSICETAISVIDDG